MFIIQQVSGSIIGKETVGQDSNEVPPLAMDINFETLGDLDLWNLTSTRAYTWDQMGLRYHNYFRQYHNAPFLQLHPVVRLVFLFQVSLSEKWVSLQCT